MKKVLVLGGGFSGVETAIFLRKEGMEVTLVSDRDYFYVNPTSIWVPTRKIAFEEVCIELKALQEVHGFELVIDKITAIRSKVLEAELASGEILKGYDYMVIATGASKMKHPGIEHTLSICGAPEEALKLRERLDALVEKGEGHIAMGFGGNPKDMSAVRGGPGFELMFNVAHMLKKRGVRDRFELTMFAPMEEPGKRMGPRALRTMDLFFRKLGIKHRFGRKIAGFDAGGVAFENGERIDADLVMFIPAGNGHELVTTSDLPTNEAGFVTVDDHCRVIYPDGDGPETVYAVGDVAALEGPQWRAKQGHIAEVMARNTAFNIMQHSQGGPERKGYHGHLNILCVMDSGDGAAFVFRNDRRAIMIPLPIVGHWIKRLWGVYFRGSKLGKIPRIPGL